MIVFRLGLVILGCGLCFLAHLAATAVLVKIGMVSPIGVERDGVERGFVFVLALTLWFIFLMLAGLLMNYIVEWADRRKPEVSSQLSRGEGV